MANLSYYKKDIFDNGNMDGRNPLENEFSFYIKVASGDTELVKELVLKKVFSQTKGVGVLSTDSVRNMKYHFVISAAMIARLCIQNGLEQDKAYSISDYYIQKMDTLKTLDDIEKLHSAMCFDFCDTMNKSKSQNAISKSITMVIDYISENIYDNITLEKLAEHVDLSLSYLSRLFYKEMNITIHEYITMAKMEKARNLLCYSEYSITEIANYLSFSSQSHFITVFKKYEGTTPKKYRDNHFRKSWSINT